MTSEELNELRENTIASLMQLQAQMVKVSTEQVLRLNNIETILSSVLERLERLEQLNRNAIGFATRDS